MIKSSEALNRRRSVERHIDTLLCDIISQHEHLATPSLQGSFDCIVYIKPAQCQASVS